MIFSLYTHRDPSWIIIAVAFVPDIDAILQRMHVLTWIGFPLVIRHGDLHNILFLIAFSLLLAAFLHFLGIRIIDGLICSAIGVAAHIFEDALVYNPAYAFLWPITSQKFGIGIMQETRNLVGVASSTVLLIGIILLALAVLLRTLVEGTDWWRVFLQGGKMDTQ